jgi:mRNA-degrading endonuclease toxin of MazEF toxin-antitoxin module
MAKVSRLPVNCEDGGSRQRIVGINRGMIFWAVVDSTIAKGSETMHDVPTPWLIVSSDNIHRSKWAIVQAVPLTSKIEQREKFRNARILLPDAEIKRYIGVSNPLRKGDSLVLTEQLRALSHDRLKGDPIAQVSGNALGAVEAGIKHVLNIR